MKYDFTPASWLTSVSWSPVRNLARHSGSPQQKGYEEQDDPRM